MNQDKPKQEVKTLSIRIPFELYLAVSQYTLDKELASLNATIIDLVTKGLTAAQDRDTIIGKFLMEIVPHSELEKMINGK